MRIAVFSTKAYDRTFLEAANAEHGHDCVFFEARLTVDTAVLARNFEVVCAFVNDQLDAATLKVLSEGDTRLIALRCAGFNNVDLEAAEQLGISVMRVPAYSPYAVAEHAVGLMLMLNRRFYRSYARVRDGNFALEGLLGFDMHGVTVGIVGTGKIGEVVARILNGFGCQLLAFDPTKNAECEALGVQYVTLETLFETAEIITLHCPLIPATRHLINTDAITRMKSNVMVINTSRGALVDTLALIEGLKSGKIGYVGLDVYEEEADLFFEDLSGQVIRDDVFARLLTFPNVVVTGHQGFFTRNALTRIAETTLENVTAFARDKKVDNVVTATGVVKK